MTTRKEAKGIKNPMTANYTQESLANKTIEKILKGQVSSHCL